MELVAQVTEDVLNRWRGPKVDHQLTILSAQLHDLGNIVKFTRPFDADLAEKLQDKLEYWYQVQDEFVAKYGTSANAANLKIVAELGLGATVGKVLTEMEIVTSRPDQPVSFEARIVEYSDCRVVPNGIVDFETRLRDLCTRYNRRADESWAKALRHNAQLVEANFL